MPPPDDDTRPHPERSGNRGDQPRRVDVNSNEDPGVRGRIRWLFTTDQTVVSFVRELAGSVLLVLLIGALLFGISGIWPPMVAIESGSMEPHMYKGDLVFVMEEHRLAPSYAHAETGVVTYRLGERHGYSKFGAHGDVIVFRPDGSQATPIIHRAHFWVNASENWYDKAEPSYVDGESCGEISNCPAPHGGYITKGDNEGSNPYYDQVSGISDPIRPDWIRGTAEVRIPYLGYVRLHFGSM